MKECILNVQPEERNGGRRNGADKPALSSQLYLLVMHYATRGFIKKAKDNEKKNQGGLKKCYLFKGYTKMEKSSF